MDVRSAMSPMSWVISPISCELSPSRLIRFEVSCTWLRMRSMAWTVFCTMLVPRLALVRASSATVADWAVFSATC
jgi:hypothetical protein